MTLQSEENIYNLNDFKSFEICPNKIVIYSSQPIQESQIRIKNISETLNVQSNGYSKINNSIVYIYTLKFQNHRKSIVDYLNERLRVNDLVYVEELRKKGFSDDEIRSLGSNAPFIYSEPGMYKMVDYNWIRKNLGKMIQMGQGSIAYYFMKATPEEAKKDVLP
jgi:hypothetical protein